MMALSGGDSIKKLPLIAALLAVALWQAPAADAVLNPGTKRLLWVSLDGGVRVIDGFAEVGARYRCDAGYRSARWEAWLQLGSSVFRFRPACDGYTHVFGARVPVPDDFSVFAEIQILILDSPLNPYPGNLEAKDQAEYFADGSGAIADADIGYARVDDQGRLEVSLLYQCAEGLSVPVESTSDMDYIEAYQVRGQHTVWSALAPVGDQVVCDGTRNQIVLHMQGYRDSDGAPAHPRMRPIQVNALLDVTDPADPPEAWGQASRRITVLP